MEDFISRNVNSMVALASFKVGNELLPLIASLWVGINNNSNLKITTLFWRPVFRRTWFTLVNMLNQLSTVFLFQVSFVQRVCKKIILYFIYTAYFIYIYYVIFIAYFFLLSISTTFRTSVNGPLLIEDWNDSVKLGSAQYINGTLSHRRRTALTSAQTVV